MWMHAARVDLGARSLVEHIAQWAVATPQAIAIESEETTCSYAELLARADRLAYWLRTHGVRHGDLVALNLPRSAQWVIALVATWRAGAAYLPLDPEWPPARCAAVIADAAPALVLHAQASDFIPDSASTQLALSDAGSCDARAL